MPPLAIRKRKPKRFPAVRVAFSKQCRGTEPPFGPKRGPAPNDPLSNSFLNPLSLECYLEHIIKLLQNILGLEILDSDTCEEERRGLFEHCSLNRENKSES